VRQGILESDNNILIIDPRIAIRVRNNDTKWMPLRLIMSLVRERGGIINYKIPITGNLKNPKFHLRDVIADLFENIFIKPPTLPYGLEVKKTEKEIEKSLGLTWQMHQSALEPRQKKFINKLIRFLKENKEASIDIYPNQYTLKEKEYILYYETKKEYFLKKQNKNSRDFSEKDSIEVDKMSVKDLAHVLAKNLSKITRDTTLFTIQDKCRHFLGDNRVDTKYSQLIKAREHSFHSLFIKEGIDSQIIIHESQSSIPYDGFSNLRIRYNGVIPHSLQKSYEAMDNLNNKRFRKKYFK
jgi:hypothetical protein